MQSTAAGVNLDVDRGPDWIFVRVNPPETTSEQADADAPQLAEAVWALLEQNFIYRCVLELDRIQLLRSYMVGQLIMLTKRIHSHGGVLRICGLSAANEEVLRCCQIADQLPNYRDRGDAVMGSRLKPR